ncbi:hypothetical protein FVE85_7759 [Porphyridium purpureum]|uniref:PWWP domain-containing protein n=1 Tax=Porphyridium purpureum TaxID=35688 RepID=A0A5J4YJC6_PORPP|nr:hypothetical protein FVE85_7759 [Porphyridium purpureum]|eukprot:POR4121..scf210_14
MNAPKAGDQEAESMADFVLHSLANGVARIATSLERAETILDKLLLLVQAPDDSDEVYERDAQAQVPAVPASVVTEGKSAKRKRTPAKVRRTKRVRVEDEGSRAASVTDAYESLVSGTAKTVGLESCVASLIVLCKAEQQIWWPARVYLDARQIPVGVKRLDARQHARARGRFSFVAVRYFPTDRNEWGIVRVTPENILPLEVFMEYSDATRRSKVIQKTPVAMRARFHEALEIACAELRVRSSDVRQSTHNEARAKRESFVGSVHMDPQKGMEHRAHERKVTESQFSSSSSEH